METKVANAFHEGEKFLQERAGTREFAQKLGETKIMSYIQDEYREFIENRHVAWICSINPKTGDVWSSSIFSTPVLQEAEREARKIKSIEEERLNKMRELKENIAEKEKILSDADKETIGRDLHSKIDELELKEEILDLEEGIIYDLEESSTILPENEAGNISFCKPFDACSIGSYSSNITSKFQSSCFRPLVRVENQSIIHILNEPSNDDPLINNIYPGSMISLNFIEFDTRKRFRINGIVLSPLSHAGFSVHVIEAFSTCPKYIQRRIIVDIREELDSYIETSERFGTFLPNHLVKLIIKSDTFMIATINEKRGADSSHRGGRKGFVRVVDDRHLVWGDYIGKGMFQTLGNTVINPHSGLLFIDWKKGDILQLSGTIKIDWETKSTATGPGTGLDDSERTVIFTVNKWIYRKGRSPYIWKYLQPSSHSPILRDDFNILNRYGTKIVSLCALRRKTSNKELFIPTTLVEIRNESPNAKTFKFQTENYIAYQPGQYTTWTIEIDGKKFMRSWTISSANLVYVNFSEDSHEHLINSSRLLTDTFEITVKRKKGGIVSNYLMDLNPKDKNSVKLTLMGIEGAFTLYSSARFIRMRNKRFDKMSWKLAMISGGIGITPIISILRGINNTFDEGILSEREIPDIVALHTETDFESICFKDDLHKLTSKNVPICKLGIALTEENNRSISGENMRALEKLVDTSSHLRFGRINQDFIQTVCPDISDRVIYLCGPEGFMGSMISILKKLGVPEVHIITESFSY